MKHKNDFPGLEFIPFAFKYYCFKLQPINIKWNYAKAAKELSSNLEK